MRKIAPIIFPAFAFGGFSRVIASFLVFPCGLLFCLLRNSKRKFDSEQQLFSPTSNVTFSTISVCGQKKIRFEFMDVCTFAGNRMIALKFFRHREGSGKPAEILTLKCFSTIGKSYSFILERLIFELTF